MIHEDGLNKTKKFKPDKYIGDPINAVKIFNEKQVDELMIIDIDKTVKNESPNFNLIQSIADECRMPLCYGGGINNEKDAQKIINMGVEKIALSSAALKDSSLCSRIANQIGTQSVVLVIDIKRNFFNNDYSIYINNGKTKFSSSLKNFLKNIDRYQIGELVINSIDRDGTQKGYDFDPLNIARDKVKVPITMLGGVGKLDDIKKLIQDFKIIGAAAGSLFVFKGKFKAVLINYPSILERINIYK